MVIQDELVERLQPLLHEYHVDMYICGHDDTLQHLIDSHNIYYYVSGNGAKRGTYSDIKQSIFGAVDPGYMIHSMNQTHMYTQIIDKDGKVLYTTVQASKVYQQQQHSNSHTNNDDITIINNDDDIMNDDGSMLDRYIKPIASKYAIRAPLLRLHAT